LDKRFLLKLFAIASHFVWEMLVAVLIGFFVGRFIDSLLDFERFFVIITMVLGALGAIANFMKRIYRLGENSDE